VLLVTTLLRLSLNVASTRIVLLEGHTGPDAAGKVIEAFGHFLVGGNYAVGLVVFIILVVINFVVITKGAGRIAEVSARFTLDAMPGKQMAIDADLNAGLIGEDEARSAAQGDRAGGGLLRLHGRRLQVRARRRRRRHHHPDHQHHRRPHRRRHAARHGGFATPPQLHPAHHRRRPGGADPGAGHLHRRRHGGESRVSSEQDLNEQIMGQMFGRPQALFLTSGILSMLGLIPACPTSPSCSWAACLGGAGYWLTCRTAGRQREAGHGAGSRPRRQGGSPQEVGWHDVAPVDRLGLEVGYRLVPLVDKHQDGELLRRIRGIRKKIAQDLGFLVPAVHIRDNLQLKPNAYRITLKGVAMAEGEAVAGKYLAINPGRVLGTLSGQAATDPAYGLPAVWIDANQRDQAQTYGYTVVDAGTVVATHLTKIINENAPELLAREETQQLLDHVAKQYPKLVEDLVPKLLPVATVQKILQNLLEEQVHIRDMRSILETLAEHAGRTQDADELTAAARTALGRAIIHETFGGAQELQVMALEPNLEHILMQALASRGDTGVGLEPGLAERLVRETVQAVERQENAGLPAVLLSPPAIRPVLARFLRRSAPGLKVLSHAEVPDGKTIRIVSLIGGG
jgi:flagellar biosynthesis protein FlhA